MDMVEIIVRVGAMGLGPVGLGTYGFHYGFITSFEVKEDPPSP